MEKSGARSRKSSSGSSRWSEASPFAATLSPSTSCSENSSQEPFNFRLPPIPTLGLFRGDTRANQRLLRYQRHLEKRKNEDAFIVQRGIKNKTRTLDLIRKKKGAVVITDDGDQDEPLDFDEFLTQEDYVEYLRDSVLSAPVTKLNPAWLKKIVIGVSIQHRLHHPETFEGLLKEVESNYIETMRNATLHFVIKNPKDYVDPYKIPEKLPPFTFAPVWAKTFVLHKKNLQHGLRLLHPMVWKTFRMIRDMVATKRLLDVNNIRDLGKAKPHEMKDAMQVDIRTNGEEFVSAYAKAVIKMYSSPLPVRGVSPERLELLFNCAENAIKCNAMMLMMGQTYLVVDAYENYEEMLPIILLDGSVEDNFITFYPTSTEIMFCFKKVVDEIVNTVQSIPDIRQVYDTRKNPQPGITFSNFKIPLPPKFLEEVNTRVASVVTEWLQMPVEYVGQLQEEFGELLSGEAKAQAEHFISEEHTFYEGVKEVARFKSYSRMISLIPRNMFFGRIYFNTDDVAAELLTQADLVKNIVLHFLLKRYRDHNQRILDGFEGIQKKLLKEPETTMELVQLTEYIDVTRGVLLSRLRDDIVEAHKQEFALLEVHVLSQLDMQMLLQVKAWNKKLNLAFEKSAIMIEEKKVEFEERLAAKTEKMKLDLKKLLRRVRDDFARYGEYSEVAKYCEDLKYVYKRIQALQAGIEWINNEETLFKFNQTQFPEIDEIMEHVEPYSKLWTTTKKWQRSERIWMDGNYWLDVAAVDALTNDYLAELLKLQELFKERVKAQKTIEAEVKQIPLSLIYDEDNLDQLPAPLRICNTALDVINQFRTSLPLMTTMCNQMLEERHWKQMSEMCGFDVTPNTGSSLRKLLLKGLETYLERFETVRYAAIEENTILQDLEKMEKEWDDTKLVVTIDDESGVKILTSSEPLLLLFEDQIAKIQLMKASQFVFAHEERVREWEATLSNAQAHLCVWLQIQTHWLTIEPAFSSKEIMPQQQEYKLCKKMDVIWKSIMSSVEDSSTAIKATSQPGLADKLYFCIVTLDKIMRGLNPESFD